MGGRKQFSEAEYLLGFFFLGGVDVISIVIDLTGVGLVIAPVIQGFATFVMLWWMYAKGSKDAFKFGKTAAKLAANALPIVPVNTIVFLVSAYLHNHPEKAGLFGKKSRRPTLKKQPSTA